jgi:predicted O-methyltransferase YrrM
MVNRLIRFVALRLLKMLSAEDAVVAIPVEHWTNIVTWIGRTDPNVILQGFGPLLNRDPDMSTMPVDLPVTDDVRFEHLAGLFASTSLDHAVISMPVRQAAYIFGLLKDIKALKVVEIGRYKGGCTLIIAAAMGGQGTLWSIDTGIKEVNLRTKRNMDKSYDMLLRGQLERFGLSNVSIHNGDSHTIEVDTGELDVVLIDGDHSYEGVRNDFERFGRRVRLGGAILFDDAFAEGIFTSHVDTVGRLLHEITSNGDYRLIKQVNRLAHVERVR